MIPTHERRILEAHIRGVRISQLDFIENHELNEYEKKELKELIKLRMKGLPLQYLIGNQAFYGRDFYVNTGVLIPRPETEGLVEEALKRLPTTSVTSDLHALEFGTGSGCIGITLTLERPDIKVWASETSEHALAVASENAKKFRAVRYSLFPVSEEPLLWQYGDVPPVDLLISNPPYLMDSDDIAQDVITHEPREALLSPDPQDPLFFYRFLGRLAHEKLKEQGIGIFEIAHNRALETQEFFQSEGFKTEILNDLTQRPRYMVIKKPSRQTAS